MIAVTGAAGFIGSCLIGRLNALSFEDVIAIDDFSSPNKLKNLNNKRLHGIVHRNDFADWIDANHRSVQHIFHLGARTDTVEKDRGIFDRLNLNYSKSVWKKCAEFGIPLTYASSAATYGDGFFSYADSHEIIKKLLPLNPYGQSKNDFDKWALTQDHQPPAWQGLKFFNVYGPNEYHKDRMASVIFHAFNQIRKTGSMRLFRSHRTDVKDGHQSRDFIYVQDILSICIFCMQRRPADGLYNAGTGHARTFLDLVRATFHAMDQDPSIEFIDTPADIRDTYQYFTEAKMDKLLSQGYTVPFHSLEQGVKQYVRDFLRDGNYY
ncbi:MAG: ADP-glyceromanno-heptose 6-epimerase [Saprospiraceae bacterium]|nr:ADP-glyceromanno-heptose 6-epimerase [Saprospiraceae bacterium]